MNTKPQEGFQMSKAKQTETIVVTDAAIDAIIAEPITTDNQQPASNAVTPKTLAEMFHIDQKTVRRHLRSKFTQPTGHEHNGSWTFKPEDPTTLLS